MTEAELITYGEDICQTIRQEIALQIESRYRAKKEFFYDDLTIELSQRDFVALCISLGCERFLLNLNDKITFRGVKVEVNPMIQTGQFRIAETKRIYRTTENETQFKKNNYEPNPVTFDSEFIKDLINHQAFNSVFRQAIEELQNELQSPSADAPSC